MNEIMDWQELVVFDSEGATGATLGSMVKDAPDSFGSLVLAGNGSIEEWDGYMVAAQDEEPDWDTPRCDVNWIGFAEALGRTII